MSPVPHSEDTLVQQTTAEYLRDQFGWVSVYAYKNRDFGPGSLLGRKDDREVVMTHTLREKLVELNPGLKAGKLRVDHWRDKEATRDAVRLAIKDSLWSDETGLPVDNYDEDEVQNRAEEVYRHVYRVYPTLPSPYYETVAAA